MIDPRTGNEVHARYVTMAPAPTTTLLPKRRCPRTLKCIWDGGTTLWRLHRVLERALQRFGLYDSLDYFSHSWKNYSDDVLTGKELWHSLWQHRGSSYRWVACYAVTGGSEGHYIHVQLDGWSDNSASAHRVSLPLWTGKTFDGYARACEIANFIGALLSA